MIARQTSSGAAEQAFVMLGGIVRGSRVFRWARWAALFLSCGLAVSIASAQPGPQTVRPTVAASRIDNADAPTIDGDLSDPGWAKATVIDNFLQVEPVPGAPSSERT